MRSASAKQGTVLSLIFSIALLSNAYGQDPHLKTWERRFKDVGIFSSPRVTDLNGDGTADVIIGVGREEFHACDSAIIALNGKDGQMLWHVPASDHLFTSAMLKDINGDGVEDVFMAGRSAELQAINGRDGSVIWKFNRKQGGIRWFNFYNGQFIADQDGDGIEDIVIPNGGNVRAAPNETKDRYPGNIVVISGKTGKLLASAAVPDGKETYMSVVPHKRSDGDYDVLFGTGGETIGGGLYLTRLSNIMKGDVRNARLLDRSATKGYIGPPIWADINADGVDDIIVNAVEGKCLAIDGATYKSVWTVRMDNTEAYSSIAPGYFIGNDQIPDFFMTYAVGTWPDLGWSKQFMVNGATGEVALVDSLGSYQTSTPVVIDINGDGIDEALLNVNVEMVDAINRVEFQNVMMLMDFKGGEVLQFGDGFAGSNISSTPWIGDLDGDGMLDVVYCHGTNIRKTYSFTGIQVHRIATSIPVKNNIRWGGYMGTHSDGIFRAR
jgi:outer membrane protein assembly factor BamB